MKLKIFIILALLFSINPSLALADVWQPPPANPPSSNRPQPIDTGGLAQTKAGDLTVQGTANFSGSAVFSGDLTVQGTANFSGSAVFSQGFTINGSPQIQFGSAVLLFNNNQSTAMDVETNLTRDQVLANWGTVIINNNNNGQAANSLYVRNSSTDINFPGVAIYGIQTGTGWAGYFVGPLGVTGNTGLTGNLTVSGNTRLNGPLLMGTASDGSVSGYQIYFGTNLSAAGQAAIGLNGSSGNGVTSGIYFPTRDDVAFTGNGKTLFYLNGPANATAVNYLQVDNSAAGNALVISAVGADSNISMKLTPKGAGNVEVNGDLNVTGLGRADHLWIGGFPAGYDQAGDGFFAGDVLIGDTIKIAGGVPGNGKVLTSDASGLASWAAPAGGGGTPGGADTQVQFNSNGAFGGDASFTYYSGNVGLGLAAGVNPNVRLDVIGAITTGDGYASGGTTIAGNGIVQMSQYLMVGTAGLVLGANENLIYGNIDTTSNGSSSLLLLQNESADKFKVNKDGYAYLANELKVSNNEISHLENTPGGSLQYQVNGSCSCADGGIYNYAPNYSLQRIVKNIQSLFIEKAQAVQCQQWVWSDATCHPGDQIISSQQSSCNGNNYYSSRICQSNSVTTRYFSKINFGASYDGTQHYVNFGLNTVNMGWEKVTNACNNTNTCTKSCSTGKKVMGGGCYTSDTSTSYLRNSYANSDTSWACLYTASVTDITVYALCARIGN